MEKIDVNIGTIPGNELIIRQGQAADVVAAPQLSISGKIGSVSEFIHKYPGLVQDNHSYLEICKTGMCLYVNPFKPEGVYSKQGHVRSVLKLSDEMVLLQFNVKFWSSKDLGDMLRLNQHMLSDSNTDIKGIIARLRNFEVEYSRKFKDVKDASGNSEFTKNQVITKCNIPSSIGFHIPIFRGDERTYLTAELEVDPESLKCVMIVPRLNELIEERAEYLIDTEVKAIRELEVGNKLPIIYLNE